MAKMARRKQSAGHYCLQIKTEIFEFKIASLLLSPLKEFREIQLLDNEQLI